MAENNLSFNQVKGNKKVRNSCLEFLRIIAMVMIVFHHFAVHGGFDFNSASMTLPRLWYDFISIGGKIGVNVFVLISGYFLVENKSDIFNFKRIIKFVSQILFYSVLFFVIGFLFFNKDTGLKTLLKTVFPLTFGKWWFASSYFVLYLLHPFINKLLYSLDKKTYQKFLILLITCFSVIPTFLTSDFQSNNLVWFICLYCIAGYLKLYGLNEKIKSKHYFALWILFTVLTYLSCVLISVVEIKFFGNATHQYYFYSQEKIPVVLTSIALFMAFATMKNRYSKIVNVIASATFGVYLIHDEKTISDFLWKEFFEVNKYQDSLYIVVYSIITVVLIYAVCTLIDLARIYILEKPFMKMINK